MPKTSCELCTVPVNIRHLSNFSNTFLFIVRHARNLIWAQTPNLRMGVSRIVGIEGDPNSWVPDGNVQVRHIR